jgi:hypothetical protein
MGHTVTVSFFGFSPSSKYKYIIYNSINRTVLEDATNTKSHGDQMLHVQWWKAPDDGHNSVRNM